MKARCTLISASLLVLLALSVAVQAQYIFTTNGDGTLNLSQYTGSDSIVIIPDATNGLPITSIGDGSFAIGWDFPYFYGLENTNLASVTIGPNVTSIGESAFAACTTLTNVTMGPNLNSIGDGAFAECSSLVNVTIPNGVTNIGTYTIFAPGHLGAFEECSSLKSIIIPNKVAAINWNTFNYCGSLTNITLGTNITALFEAFDGCPITSITIPASVSGILNTYFPEDPDTGTFTLCSDLTTIDVDPKNPYFSSIDGVLFNKSQTVLWQYPIGRTGSYTIPDSVNHFGQAFANCSSLTSVKFGSGVSNVTYWAFLYCAGLTNVTIGTNISYIDPSAFGSGMTSIHFLGNCPDFGPDWVPDDRDMYGGISCLNATVYYLPGATGWGTNFGALRTELWTWPTASNICAATKQNLSVSIPLAKVLLFASAPVGDPLSITAAGSTSTHGGTVVLNDSAITYTPPTCFTGTDRFSYTVSDGWGGGTATADVVVDVTSDDATSFNMCPLVCSPGCVVVSFAGIVGRTYSVQRAPSVAGPWTTLGTATVGSNGIATFRDTNPPLGSAFYRTSLLKDEIKKQHKIHHKIKSS
jgi:hypothetical protein